jgi:hypothetical protein
MLTARIRRAAVRSSRGAAIMAISLHHFPQRYFPTLFLYADELASGGIHCYR